MGKILLTIYQSELSKIGQHKGSTDSEVWGLMIIRVINIYLSLETSPRWSQSGQLLSTWYLLAPPRQSPLLPATRRDGRGQAQRSVHRGQFWIALPSRIIRKVTLGEAPHSFCHERGMSWVPPAPNVSPPRLSQMPATCHLRRQHGGMRSCAHVWCLWLRWSRLPRPNPYNQQEATPECRDWNRLFFFSTGSIMQSKPLSVDKYLSSIPTRE